MSSFSGKTAIVTGGASGIGDVNGDLGRKLSSRLGATNAKFIEMDVSRSSDCRRAVEAAQSAFGGLDFLVNCAITRNTKPLIELSEVGARRWTSSYRDILDVPSFCCAFGSKRRGLAR